MKISVFGAGYVGLVTGSCLAECGHDVTLMDVDAGRVAVLQAGESPIYEPGLSELMRAQMAAGRLRFTVDAKEAVTHGDALFIAVGTPSDADGSADCSAVWAVAESIATHMQGRKLIIDKSTVPVGTAAKVAKKIEAVQQQVGKTIEFSVASNPEFLREGVALQDFMQPDRIVVGISAEWAGKMMQAIYAPLVAKGARLITMDVPSAELTKYAANAMLATRISFINEISRISESVGADIQAVREGIGSDSRIGPAFINPGCGYGGSCFPKDVRALGHTARELGLDAHILNAVEAVNASQKQWLAECVLQHFGGDVSGKVIALWGLAFKPETDDIRDAPSRVLLETLWQQGTLIQAYDPQAMANIRRHYGSRADLCLVDSPEAALHGAHALVIATEWDVFKAIPLARVAEQLSQPVVIDGRHVYSISQAQEANVSYYTIGQRASMQHNVKDDTRV